MYASAGGYINKLPEWWEHDPTLKDNYGCTVAMIAACRGHINKLPKYWEHDPTL